MNNTEHDQELYTLAVAIGDKLRQQGLSLCSAESCTGGGIAYALTAVPGSSAWFERGFITYSNQAKHEMLGVTIATLTIHGAVSRPTVTEMAAGARRYSQAHISVAVSGIAGPGGGSRDKPVGTVWLAWDSPKGAHQQCYHFNGSRTHIRHQAIRAALQGINDCLV
jgi:nicotinamide-nucleotide amidase